MSDISKNTISPYEIVMLPRAEGDFSCKGCILHEDKGYSSCKRTADLVCNGYGVPRLAHKVSGVILTDVVMAEEYSNHKKEHGKWVSYRMK